MCRVVQLNFTPEIEVFFMPFEISISIFRMTSLKQHIAYLNSRCKIQLDLPLLTTTKKMLQVLTWRTGQAKKKWVEADAAVRCSGLSGCQERQKRRCMSYPRFHGGWVSVAWECKSQEGERSMFASHQRQRWTSSSSGAFLYALIRRKDPASSATSCEKRSFGWISGEWLKFKVSWEWLEIVSRNHSNTVFQPDMRCRKPYSVVRRCNLCAPFSSRVRDAIQRVSPVFL